MHRFGTALAACLLLAPALPAEEIDFDRPEAWAMKYFSSVTLLSPVVAGRPGVGELDLGFEVGWIPHLSEDQRRVGFDGVKLEDLNKMPVLPRPRVRIGLPADLLLDVAYVPPIEVSGVEAHILSLGLQWEMASAGSWAWSLRGHGQLGRIEGDYTCPADIAAYPPGSEENIWGCEAPSSDVSTLNHLGAAVLATWRGASATSPAVQLGLLATYHDLEFQVDAITYGYHDRARLETDGMTYAVTAGADLPVSERFGVALEAFYSPLDVVRTPSTSAENDGLFNVRAVVSYRWR